MREMKLELLRDEKDYTKKQIAKILGVSDSVYARWENGKEIIPTERIYQLANYYTVNIDYLLGFTLNRLVMKSNEEIDLNIVSERVKEIRQDFKETLRTFSDKLNTSNSTWSAYETGKVLILSAFLIEVCEMGKYSADWILGRSDEKYIEK